MQYVVVAVAALAGILLILLPLLPAASTSSAEGSKTDMHSGPDNDLQAPPRSVVAVVPYARVDDMFLATWRARAAAACKERPLWDDACKAVLPQWPVGEPRRPPWVREEGALAQDQALRLTVMQLRRSCPWLKDVVVLAPRGQPLPPDVDARLLFHDELRAARRGEHGPLPSFAPCSWASVAASLDPTDLEPDAGTTNRAVLCDAVLVVPPTCVLRGAWTLWDFFTPTGQPVVHTRRRLVRGIVPVLLRRSPPGLRDRAAARLPCDCRGDVMAVLAVGAVHRASTDGDGPLSRCVVEDVPALRTDEPWAGRYARASERLLKRVRALRNSYGWA